MCIHSSRYVLQLPPASAHPAQDPKLKAKKIVLYSSSEYDKKANAVLLLALYAVRPPLAIPHPGARSQWHAKLLNDVPTDPGR